MLSPSTILLAAHAATRARRAPLRYPTAEHALDRAAGAFVCTVPYKAVFAIELRKAWAEAKARVALDALQAAPVVLTDTEAAEIARLEQLANWSPITFLGNERCAALRLQAACIRSQAARAMQVQA